METKDIKFLQTLAGSFDHILKIIVNLQNQHTEEAKERKNAVNAIANLIGEIKRGGCHYSFYSSLSISAKYEEDRGFVEILSKVDDPETWETKYKCKCLLCGKCYSVYEKEAGFGRSSSWKRYS